MRNKRREKGREAVRESGRAGMSVDPRKVKQRMHLDLENLPALTYDTLSRVMPR